MSQAENNLNPNQFTSRSSCRPCTLRPSHSPRTIGVDRHSFWLSAKCWTRFHVILEQFGHDWVESCVDIPRACPSRYMVAVGKSATWSSVSGSDCVTTMTMYLSMCWSGTSYFSASEMSGSGSEWEGITRVLLSHRPRGWRASTRSGICSDARWKAARSTLTVTSCILRSHRGCNSPPLIGQPSCSTAESGRTH